MRVEAVEGDITEERTDAIVNAANSSLLGGGGVDGAIHRAAGPALLEACQKIRAAQGGCDTGQAVITPAGKLPARYVIHTVGPVWQGGTKNEPELLAGCYRHSLELAVKNGLKTIAFPNISTGVYGYPKDKAAEIAIKTVTDFLETNTEIEEVQFVVFDDENYRLYEKILAKS